MKYRLGRVTKDGKHIYFKMNNSEYIIDAPIANIGIEHQYYFH